MRHATRTSPQGSTPVTLTLYDASIPIFLRAFGNLSHLIDKAVEYAAAKSMDPGALIESRLAPDMDPFRSQIQRASDTAKGCATRLAGRPVPAFEDTETTFEELQARIAKTVELLETISPDELVESADRTIKINMRHRSVTFDGKTYLFNFAIPNFFFHVTTAYAILRHNGVNIGKLDYLGQL
jgi:uncharacterized protein